MKQESPIRTLQLKPSVPCFSYGEPIRRNLVIGRFFHNSIMSSENYGN